MRIKDSELIINQDGSVFHLHLKPEDLAEKVILVGDPERVNIIGGFLDHIELNKSNREFNTITGHYKGKRVSVISTGIGCDNIDIVVNEIDALANINLETRTCNKNLKQLDICRIGTCGGIQEFCRLGEFVASKVCIGLDGLINFYENRDQICNSELERAFVKHMEWKGNKCIQHPYVVNASNKLLENIGHDMIKGITVTCPGFYAPQGRTLRIGIADPLQNKKIEAFRYENNCITNYEMECSALYGLSKLLGHNALTCCMVVANRHQGESNPNYKESLKRLIRIVLERI